MSLAVRERVPKETQRAVKYLRGGFALLIGIVLFFVRRMMSTYEAETDMTPEKIQVLTQEEALALLDRQARRYLDMSGEEFIRRWQAGEFRDQDRPEVMRVAMLLPDAA